MNFSNYPLKRLDPRSKILSFSAIFLCIIFSPITRPKDFGLYFLLLLAIALLSGITPAQIIKKIYVSILILFFLGMFFPFIKKGSVFWSFNISHWKLDITYEGIWIFLNITVKSALSIFLLATASLTTSLTDFSYGLYRLHLPRSVISSFSFSCCCIIMLLEETGKVLRGKTGFFYCPGNKNVLQTPANVNNTLSDRVRRKIKIIRRKTILRKNREGISNTEHFRYSLIDFLFVISVSIVLLFIFFGWAYTIKYIKMNDTHLWQRF
ncbi:MAG: energy-coupling factor transporter transmembrane protein EcfT [Candidatus Brocadiaceae bacterium]|nr:energy-coupling factor transporter transmembrane protein EcfT [Candidatus Brocadiaceae bacterium]